MVLPASRNREPWGSKKGSAALAMRRFASVFSYIRWEYRPSISPRTLLEMAPPRMRRTAPSSSSCFRYRQMVILEQPPQRATRSSTVASPWRSIYLRTPSIRLIAIRPPWYMGSGQLRLLAQLQ